MHADSYTRAMIKWLVKPHFFVACPGGMGKVLGGGPQTAENLKSCFERMRSWTILARDVLSAEFPSSEIIP